MIPSILSRQLVAGAERLCEHYFSQCDSTLRQRMV